MILASSPTARSALVLVRDLQARMVRAHEQGRADRFTEITWLRDDGRHGGGDRRFLADTPVFDRATVNVSQVHYDDELTRRLSSATALSTIIHPRHPHAPSVHIHASWTEMRDGSGSWRIMADLNPAIAAPAATAAFAAALRAAAPELFAEANRQGDAYFFIPALRRHRGVVHFYLEQHVTADPLADAALARAVVEIAIDTHAQLVRDVTTPITDHDRAAQLAYHTLYAFQVLTLDRGTTSGLLVHDQNDEGILGSLPSHLDRALFASWRARVIPPIDRLVDELVGALPPEPVVLIDAVAKRALAAIIRAFYRANPDALALQAEQLVRQPT